MRELADTVIPQVTDSGVAWAIEKYLLDGEVRYRNANTDDAHSGEGNA